VVEDHSHYQSAPQLALSAKLADRPLQTRVVETLLEVVPREGRALDEDLLEWPLSLKSRPTDRDVWVKVLR
jgi:hypothetical protein